MRSAHHCIQLRRHKPLSLTSLSQLLAAAVESLSPPLSVSSCIVVTRYHHHPQPPSFVDCCVYCPRLDVSSHVLWCQHHCGPLYSLSLATATEATSNDRSSFSSIVIVLVLSLSSSLTPTAFNNDIFKSWCCLWLLPLAEKGCYGRQPDDNTKLLICLVVTRWPPQTPANPNHTSGGRRRVREVLGEGKASSVCSNYPHLLLGGFLLMTEVDLSSLLLFFADCGVIFNAGS